MLLLKFARLETRSSMGRRMDSVRGQSVGLDGMVRVGSVHTV